MCGAKIASTSGSLLWKHEKDGGEMLISGTKGDDESHVVVLHDRPHPVNDSAPGRSMIGEEEVREKEEV